MLSWCCLGTWCCLTLLINTFRGKCRVDGRPLQVCLCGQCPPAVPGASDGSSTPASPSPSASPTPAQASPSPSPAVQPSPLPLPRRGITLALQTGGRYKALNGSMGTYNGTVDAWISTQDVADYNNFQVSTATRERV
jgi:hypothetical protein